MSLNPRPGGAPPSGHHAFTALVAVLVLIAWVVSFFLQVLVAIPTLPLLFLSNGKMQFHHWQSLVWRGMNGLLGVVLNPLWSVKVSYFGTNPGVPKQGSVGSIIFCNHRSNADPWCTSYVMMISGTEARFIYKSSLKNLPFGGWCEQLAGGLAVKFGDKDAIVKMLDDAREVLRSGYNIFVFPEGTRSPSGVLQDFKPSFFQIAAELGCPVVPVCMIGTEKAWPISSGKAGCAKVLAGVGSPLYSGAGGAEALSQAVAEKMREMAIDLLEQERGPEDEEGVAADGDRDPFLTGRPYAYWTPPAEIADLSAEEQLRLLKSGKTHHRGANLL